MYIEGIFDLSILKAKDIVFIGVFYCKVVYDSGVNFFSMSMFFHHTIFKQKTLFKKCVISSP